jgi:uncharacterized protein YndB with AHSA1/START domain
MTTKNEILNDTRSRELVVSRLINAPRELVYQAWTDPKHVNNWWGPSGFTNTTLEMNVKPGGVWRFIMHGPNGVDYPNRIVFEEVVKPERLVYTHSDDIDDDPERFHVIVTFEKQGNKTLLTMKTLFKSAEQLQKVVKEHGALEGASQTLDRLEAYLPKM